jgi:hypothetical protein
VLTPATAYWIAHVVFWGLLATGVVRRELRTRSVTIVLLLWLAGYFGLPYVTYGNGLYVALVAALDIALVLIIFKRDVRLI